MKCAVEKTAGKFFKNRQFANSLEKVPLAEEMFLQKVI
jgi:hypothetical protein